MLEGKIDLNKIENRDTREKIRYLLLHDELEDSNPDIYNRTLLRLMERYLKEKPPKR